MTRSLGGIIAPVVTPFDVRTGDADLDGFASNVHAHLEAGMSGVVVCGSTGEAALLDEAERRALVERARREVPGDAWLIVGTGAEATRLCVRRCREAKERGADAVLVVSPHYYGNAMTPTALETHFRAVADVSPLPVLLYNIPKYAHLTLEPELIARLAMHENIVGMKDSAGDMTRFAGYVASQGPGFTVLTGHGGTVHQALQLGARGAILAVALFAPELSLGVWKHHQTGEASSAEEAQRALVPLAAEIVARHGVAGVKQAMDLVGLRGGPVRLPLLALGAAERSAVEALLRGAGVAAVA
jgi:4-hydroxy-2-oxoglutarate aldolase